MIPSVNFWWLKGIPSSIFCRCIRWLDPAPYIIGSKNYGEWLRILFSIDHFWKLFSEVYYYDNVDLYDYSHFIGRKLRPRDSDCAVSLQPSRPVPPVHSPLALILIAVKKKCSIYVVFLTNNSIDWTKFIAHLGNPPEQVKAYLLKSPKFQSFFTNFFFEEAFFQWSL